MIADNLTLTHICTSFEGVLKLEYNDNMRTEECLDNAIKSLENAYAIKIDKDIYSLQAENSLVSQQLDQLLLSITECMKTTALYTTLAIFNHNIGISLADANYLGCARERLLTGLKYFQDKDLYPKRSQIVSTISEALNTIAINHVKRLFMILLILERLGVSEGVAIVAQLLWLGGMR